LSFAYAAFYTDISFGFDCADFSSGFFAVSPDRGLSSFLKSGGSSPSEEKGLLTLLLSRASFLKERLGLTLAGANIESSLFAPPKTLF
jgi:hypothetical protein